MMPNEIKVECQLNNDDIIAWHYYYLQNSPEWKRLQKSKFFVYSSAVMLSFVGLIAILKGIMTEFSPWGWTGVCAVLFGLAPVPRYLLTQRYLRNKIKKKVNELYGHGKDSLVGIHKYTISPQGVHDATEMDDTTFKWKAIDNIVQTREHIFILSPPQSAFLISKRAFPDEVAFNKFFKDINTIFQAAKTAS